MTNRTFNILRAFAIAFTLAFGPLLIAQTILTIQPGGSITINSPAIVIPPPATQPTPPVVTPPPTTAPTPGPSVAGFRPIADWTTVPFQAPAGTINIGVIAFCDGGIANVAYSLDGGVIQRVNAPSLNPQTNVIEYWYPAPKATNKVDATVTAHNGQTLKLPTLLLNQPANILVYRGQRFTSPPQAAVSALQSGRHVWFDNCELDGGSRFNAVNWNPGFWNGSRWVNNSYFTNCTITRSADGPRGALLVRNTTIKTIGSNFITGVRTAINVDGYDCDPGSTGWHPDFYHGQGALPDQVILYGCTAGVTNNDRLPKSRGINFAEPTAANVAVVNCTINTSGGFGTALELGNTITNMLIKDSRFIGGTSIHRGTFTRVVLDKVTTSAGWGDVGPNQPGVTVR